MSTTLSRQELEVIQGLCQAKLSLPAATLAVVMLTRDHARPQRELADIVRQYPNLEKPVLAEQAITDLLKRNWLTVVEAHDSKVVQRVNNLRELIAGQLSDPSCLDHLMHHRDLLAGCVRLVSREHDALDYSGYKTLLAGAQRHICLPMLATSPHLSSVSIIQERARSGVTVRILLGSPNVVAAFRGETQRQLAESHIKGWVQNARDIPNIQVRISHSIDDMLIGTCMSVDSRVVRFGIHDPHRQRSLTGLMLEVMSPSGYDLNFINVFQRYFDAAWSSAQPVGTLSQMTWWFRQRWQLWCGVLFAIAALYYQLKKSDVGTVLAGVLASCSATFVVNGLVEWWPEIRTTIRRLF